LQLHDEEELELGIIDSRAGLLPGRVGSTAVRIPGIGELPVLRSCLLFGNGLAGVNAAGPEE
jgi:hypothetical protein